MTRNSKYVLEVWLLTVCLIAPMFLAGYSLFQNISSHSEPITLNIAYTLVFIIYGLLYSAPLAFLLFGIFYFMTDKQCSVLVIKFTLIILFLTGIYIMHFFIFDSHTLSPIYYPYIFGALISSFYFKVYEKEGQAPRPEG
jgi:hypothetical protein